MQIEHSANVWFKKVYSEWLDYKHEKRLLNHMITVHDNKGINCLKVI